MPDAAPGRWRVIDNPFGTNDPIVVLPAIRPDVALIHAPMADRAGNVWIGRQRELATMAHAGRRTVVTVEKLVAGNLLDDPIRSACPTIMPPTSDISASMPASPRPPKVSRAISSNTCSRAARHDEDAVNDV